MNSLSAERLWSLLPALHRVRDAQHGELRDLVELFAEQFAALEDNSEQLYDDLFIETCADWVAPYIGDLIGYRTLHGVVPAVASPRADVANTIAYRRRKGTATMLEQMARDVTGWPAHAVEFFEQLVTTQYMNHLRPQARGTPDLRDTATLLARASGSGAFNRIAHTAEMRRPEPAKGRFNIPNIGLFLWRIEALPLTRVPLVADPGDASGQRWRVNPLGADLALFRRPVTEASIDVLAQPVNVPAPLSVRAMALQVRAAQASDPAASVSDDWGAGRSVVLFDGAGAPVSLNRPPPLPGDPAPPLLRICDLRDDPALPGAWAHEADLGADELGLDPALGRILLGSNLAASHAAAPFTASFHLGQMRRIGGGEYERSLDGEALQVQRTVAGGADWQPALDDIAAGGRLVIDDSLPYALTPTLRVEPVTTAGAPGHTVVVTARNGARPLLAAGGDLTLDIGARGTLVLDGLVISGAMLRLPAAADNEPRTLVLRDCTLVPGRTLQADGAPATPGAPSLEIEHPFASVRIERSIVGAVRSHADAQISISGSAIDATDPTRVAYEGLSSGGEGAELALVDATVVGLLHARLLTLASNTIFQARLPPAAAPPWTAAVRVQRRQQGCLRFSWLPAGAVTPRRHHCVSDEHDPSLRPQFTSVRYGDAAYLQLAEVTPPAIRQGADDEGEIGLMHPLAQPQREANLRIRLDEYLRFGLAAGLFYAD
ncbi:MAG: hypothetical protein OEU93_06465 [Rubrivivax sp.]|nr:hypothetical protein [Rubrivivax sp.]MDH5339873.1 hypothetical protein [Rubrivivax sp.]